MRGVEDSGGGCQRRDDAASYVLDALDEVEVEAFTAHLADCAVCQAEVAELRPVAQALALGVATVEPPPELRARLMAPVNAEADRHDIDAASEPAQRELPTGDRSARRTDRFASRLLARRSLLPGLATAAALGVGLLVGALALGDKTGATKVELIPASVVAPGHHASAVLRKAGNHLELVVLGMPAPPPGHIYEVWLERGSREPEATDALFSVTHAGTGAVGVPGYEAGVSQVLVTAEPLGGTLKPTQAPVIVAKV
jgi:hypothetical protein